MLILHVLRFLLNDILSFLSVGLTHNIISHERLKKFIFSSLIPHIILFFLFTNKLMNILLINLDLLKINFKINVNFEV